MVTFLLYMMTFQVIHLGHVRSAPPSMAMLTAITLCRCIQQFLPNLYETLPVGDTLNLEYFILQLSLPSNGCRTCGLFEHKTAR